MEKKILVVDDEQQICEFLQAFFEDRKYSTEVAHSGEEALQKIPKFQPHLVLLDIAMPGMNGLQVLKEVKSKYPGTRVIMVTAIETREKIEEALRLGADNYITKPLSLEYLEKDVQEKIARLTQ